MTESSPASPPAVSWGDYDETDLAALRDLAEACLAQDGGLPLLTDDGLLRARMLGGDRLAGRDADGRIVAAASLLVRDGAATTTGMVHPDHRRRGLGGHLLDWALAEARDPPLTVLTETCSAGAEALYARAGLTRSFAELVMRHSLETLPTVPEPDGLTLRPVADADPGDLFAAYVGAFSDRPGFPDPSQEEWLEELEEDDEWRRDLSTVVLDEHGSPVGFVNVIGRWVDQVGVVPGQRGRRVGAFLVARALAALAAEGAEGCWLTVNVDNPAADLYTGLGFEVFGMRARFTR
jgi:mycothiol synthase